MMHEIGREMLTELRARSCPFDVVDGPEDAKTATWGRERIVLEEFGDDSFQGPLSHHKNPKQPAALVIGGKATIYAKSPRAGALPWEHRRRARKVMRMVVGALRKVLVARKNPVSFTGGGFFVPEDMADTERAGGAAYALTFEFVTGVPDITFAGDADPEVEIGGVDGVEINTTRIASINGSESTETF
jgi:hypothetical protein